MDTINENEMYKQVTFKVLVDLKSTITIIVDDLSQ